MNIRNNVTEIKLDNTSYKMKFDFETIARIQAELKKNGINVTAKYSKIAGGIVIESGDMGQDASFSLKVGSGTEKTYQGQNAKGVI